MKNDFALQKWLEELIGKEDDYYRSIRDYEACGQIFPLVQKMKNRDKHSVLGFRTEKGRESYGAENCYFLFCDSISDEILKQNIHLLDVLTERDVDDTDPLHEFTFMNLVLLTKGFADPAAKKSLHRYRFMEDYSKYKGHYGWCSKNICVVDLEDGKIYSSANGQTLRERIGGKPESLFSKWIKK